MNKVSLFPKLIACFIILLILIICNYSEYRHFRYPWRIVGADHARDIVVASYPIAGMARSYRRSLSIR